MYKNSLGCHVSLGTLPLATVDVGDAQSSDSQRSFFLPAIAFYLSDFIGPFAGLTIF